MTLEILERRNEQVLSDDDLLSNYHQVRRDSESICTPLEIEDYGIQTMPSVSPPKWHLAHTSWFFETLLLKPFLADYSAFHPLYSHLFNSYYNSIGSQHARPERGLLSRPTVNEVYQYRKHVDASMRKLLNQKDHRDVKTIRFRTELGLNHEQQHQELMLTDIKHIFAYNPLKPVYLSGASNVQRISGHALEWLEFQGGLTTIGFKDAGFCYDNEKPAHQTYVNPFRLASRPVSNGEFIQFIESGAYKNPRFWLSDAWKIVNEQNWKAPLYWEKIDGQWWNMTLNGMQKIMENTPVHHVSYYEAAAYAAWAGKRLPTEAEWEIAATPLPVRGNLRDWKVLQPLAAESDENQLQQMYGDVWEWTQSPYTAYPGYRQVSGPLGEYNGKFMSSQMVLRGGSCVTPKNHIRYSYRNFFYPDERWQFSGFRLAEDIL